MYIDKTSYRNAGRVGVPRSELSLCWKKPPPAPPEFCPNRPVGTGPRNAGQRHERAGLGRAAERSGIRTAARAARHGATWAGRGNAPRSSTWGKRRNKGRHGARPQGSDAEPWRLGAEPALAVPGCGRNGTGAESGRAEREGTLPRQRRTARSAAGGARPADEVRLPVKTGRPAGKAGAKPASRGACGHRRHRHSSGRPNRSPTAPPRAGPKAPPPPPETPS